MTIDDLLLADGSQDYYDPSLRVTLEAHMDYLKNSTGTLAIPVDPHDNLVYRNDLYGFLNKLNLKPCLHWIIMRMNDFSSTTDFKESVTSIYLPSEQELERIRLMWKTTQKINA